MSFVNTSEIISEIKKRARMTILFSRASLKILALGCFVLLSSVSQRQIQAQVLTVDGNSQVVDADAAQLFDAGAREIVFAGMFDIDMSTFEDRIDVSSPFGTVRSVYIALAGNTSEVSLDLQNDSGVVIGTFTTSNLRQLSLSSTPNGTYSATFLFDDPLFTSTDPETAGIVGTSLQFTVSDFDFTGPANFNSGLTPDDFLANVSNCSFIIDESDVEFLFANNGSSFVERVAILQSDPNQTFTLPTTSILLGDVNLSGGVNFADIAPFIAILSAGGFQKQADINQDNMVDFSDIAPFITILSGS